MKSKNRGSNIILCGFRIRVLNSKTHKDKLQAASDAAMALVSYYGDKSLQTIPISTLQHEIMDNFDTWNKTEAGQKVTEMFQLLDSLEDEIEHGGYK